jgi:hypothetical protein
MCYQECGNVKDVNRDMSGVQRTLWSYVISAKRYSFFIRCGRRISIVEPSEHGLGYLLDTEKGSGSCREESNPREPGGWIRRMWEHIVNDALGCSALPLPYTDLPAVGRISVSSPHALRPFTKA